MLTACAVCGEPSEDAHCPEHRAPQKSNASTAKGYDAAWQRLSKQARREQPFCSTCLTTRDLTTDHTPEAWARKAKGLPIRLRDVDVLCRSCNARKGAAR